MRERVIITIRLVAILPKRHKLEEDDDLSLFNVPLLNFRLVL